MNRTRMKMHFSNLIKFPGLLLSVIISLKVQKRFIKETLALDIEKSKQENDNSLNESDFRKITNYYGFAVPAIMGEGFCLLRGKGMSASERTALTYLGALTGLFDDFFDKKDLPEQYLKTMIEEPESVSGKDANERLFLRFLVTAHRNTDNLEVLKKMSFEVHDAQVLSKKQKEPSISQEQIKDITLQKGGFSILFYRSVFQDPADEKERKMLYYLGGTGQMENDLFDVYKDSIDGIQTLATTATKIDALRKVYSAFFEKTISMVYQTDFPLKNKKKFLRFVALTVARGFVCLDFLEKSEKRTNHVFSPKDYTRKDLICDMGTLRNNLKLIGYYLKCDISEK